MNSLERSASTTRRILSLDGGGIRGVYSAAVLAGIEESTGKSISDHFDLIVGTSTGGIIALGLGLGLSASEILQFYEQRGPSIFRSGFWANTTNTIRHPFRSKHSQDDLKRELASVFGSRPLGESKNRLVIVSYDGTRGNVHLLKTRHLARFRRDHTRLAVDVALATSAAPTFFPSSMESGTCEVDGGVWANCPALVGVIEGMSVLGWGASSLRLLSVGTTRPTFHVEESWRSAGFLGWIRSKRLIELFSEAQVSGALAQASLLAGKENVIRIDETVTPGRFSLDDARTIPELKALGMQAARHAEPVVNDLFLTSLAEPFIPLNL